MAIPIMTETAAVGVTPARNSNLSDVMNLAAVSISLQQNVFDLSKKILSCQTILVFLLAIYH